jgi:alpha-L-fucosidase
LNAGKDMAKYRQYLYNQITELMSNYGKIDVLWVDFSFPGHEGHGKGKDDWGSVELIKQIRKLQPGIIINNRLDLNSYEDGGDFETPEQVSPAALEKYRGKVWETCQTFSGSWGYYRDENTWKTNRQLLNLLITSVANGGNLILNVGPTARGEFDYRANTALDSLALWMHANDKSIYNCTYAPADFKVPDSARLTYNPSTKKLYVHLFNYPTTGNYVLPGYGGKIKYAQFLNDDSEILTADKKRIEESITGADITLSLPIKKPNFEIPVIELSLK